MSIPNGSKIIGNYLRSHPLVVAMETRIVGKSPAETSHSWVRLSQIGAPSVNGNRPGHLYEFLFQLDCYAGSDGGQPEATDLAIAVHDALAAFELSNYRSNGAVVTGSDPNMGGFALDTDLEPARERFISTATVWMHS
jgi:hypothetical protein